MAVATRYLRAADGNLWAAAYMYSRERRADISCAPRYDVFDFADCALCTLPQAERCILGMMGPRLSLRLVLNFMRQYRQTGAVARRFLRVAGGHYRAACLLYEEESE